MSARGKIASLLLLGIVLCLASPVLGQKPPSKEQLKGLEKEKNNTKEEIARQDAKRLSVLSELNTIDRGLEEKRADLQIFKLDLEQNQKRKEIAQAELALLKEKIEENLASVKRRLRAIYKTEGGGLLRVVFSSESISDLLQSMTLMRYIARYDAQLLTRLQENRERHLQKLKELEEYDASVNLSKMRAMEEEEELEKRQGERRALLEEIKKDKARQLSLLKDIERRSEELRKKLDTWTQGDSSSTFGTLKGRLPWPVKGRVLNKFGLQYEPALKRKTLSNGLHIEAPFGSEVVSIAQGKVIFAGWFFGYGKMIIIDHGSGYASIYAHTSELYTKEGETVKSGEKIAAVGDTDSVRGPDLYFEIRHKGEPQDPLLWLGKRK